MVEARIFHGRASHTNVVHEDVAFGLDDNSIFVWTKLHRDKREHVRSVQITHDFASLEAIDRESTEVEVFTKLHVDIDFGARSIGELHSHIEFNAMYRTK